MASTRMRTVLATQPTLVNRFTGNYSKSSDREAALRKPIVKLVKMTDTDGAIEIYYTGIILVSCDGHNYAAQGNNSMYLSWLNGIAGVKIIYVNIIIQGG